MINTLTDNYRSGLSNFTSLSVPKSALPVANYRDAYKAFLNDKIGGYLRSIKDRCDTIERHIQSIKNHRNGKYDYRYSEEKKKRLIKDHKEAIVKHIKAINHLKTLIKNELLDKQDLDFTNLSKKVKNIREDVLTLYGVR